MTALRKELDLNEIREYLATQSFESKVYIGCDSSRFKRYGLWYADYALVVVIHIDGKHGCKIFGCVTTERDYTADKKKPSYRLMNECYKVSEAYLALYDVLGDREVELHLDINPDPRWVSNIVVQQAIGYIKASCGVTPMVKPEAFAASYAADRLAAGLFQQAA